ncbi:pentapeptide repeat-containing protein [Pleurocapsales cyanobacterium LEGE 10410]|nr:pentapeptide repeat-containing protein [Pleurocapsales cyanobacterium LEGE 10410]
MRFAQSKNVVIKIFQVIAISACLALSFCKPLQAVPSESSYLTVEILQERGQNLIQQDGKDTINLTNYIIDLSNPSSELSQQLYREINNIVSRASNPIKIDFSDAIIQGDFRLNQLGIFTTIGEGALFSLFTPSEQKLIEQYYPLANNVGQQIPLVNVFRGELKFDQTVFTGEVDGSNSLFLQPVTATSAKFQAVVKLDRAIFGREVDFSQAVFEQPLSLLQSHFFAETKFNQVKFEGITDFKNSQFEQPVDFSESMFNQLIDFTRSVFISSADFSQTIFRDRLVFAKSKFLNSLIFINSTLKQPITFRDIYVNSTIDLQDAHLLNRIDFSNAFFTSKASINVSGLTFDSTEAKIIGQTGVISKFVNVKRLAGNETVLRNLIRNFRSLEQIADANYLEFKQKQLRVKQIGDRLANTTWRTIFSWTWISLIFQWLGLNLLLLLGDYGTNINLLFNIGIIAIALFSLVFWWIDRYRPSISQPIMPTRYEITMMLGSYLILTMLGIVNIFLTTDRPWIILIGIAIILLPIPTLITSLIYLQGRYHKLLNTSYFVENGQFREFRLLLGRLPIIPRFPFFRERYQPILWDKRWGWLNYYDFSLNNIFKLGFNDIRLRDRHLPGLISTLVWYQWCLGVLYIVLLLWTLSRTIPGLNLLIYF